jgi:hypothetical protein
MNPSWLERYVDAWSNHPRASGSDGDEEAMSTLLGFMSEDVRYEDVPTGAVFVGHDGIREMGAGPLEMSADMTFDIVQRVTGQRSYAFETICRGTNTDQSVRFRAEEVPSPSAVCPSGKCRKMASSSRKGTTVTSPGSLGSSVSRSERLAPPQPPVPFWMLSGQGSARAWPQIRREGTSAFPRAGVPTEVRRSPHTTVSRGDREPPDLVDDWGRASPTRPRAYGDPFGSPP